MSWKRSGLLAIGIALALTASAPAQQEGARDFSVAPADGGRGGGYSYIRETSGDVSLDSRWNGRVEASRNLPVSVGDRIDVSGGGRAEIALADGTALFVGGGSKASFESLRDQQGENDAFSVVRLEDGSLILAARGSDENAVPRIDTDDVTVYLNPGSRARVNFDSNRGTSVVAREGTVDVRTRAGRYELRAGEYLMIHGDEEPEIQRGDFSRDRFDIWATDRLGYDDTRSASARHVDSDRADDVVAMDGYGDWSYNDDYQTDVWSPRVAPGWSPYSNGSWYYTPAGLTWWSSDPWGWCPFHWGNWFFDSGWNRWCWAPGSVFSPAWVWWGFTDSFVGWCPVGFFSPWFDNFALDLRFNGLRRADVFLSVHGVFSTRAVDFRGWNFVGAGNLGTTAGRMAVIPGSRIAGRLPGSVAISSRPIVVSARPGGAREAVQGFVRQAPRVIERTSTGDSSRLAPLLARQRTLPASTIDAIRQHVVVADRGRLAGPGVADIAPRGAIVDRTRTLPSRGNEMAPRETARVDRGRDLRTAPSDSRSDTRTAPAREPRTLDRGRDGGAESGTLDRQRALERWRGTLRSPAGETTSPGRAGRSPEAAPPPRGQVAPPSRMEAAPAPRVAPRSSDWRGQRSFQSFQTPRSSRESIPGRAAEDWRGRGTVPPARRVIEGSVPGRAMADPQRAWRPRSFDRPRERENRPEVAPAPRFAPRREFAPPPQRFESRRDFAPPPRREFAPPQQRFESRPAPRPEPRSAPSRSAPAPHSAPHSSSHHGQ